MPINQNSQPKLISYSETTQISFFFYLFAKYGHIRELLVQGSHNTSLGRAVGLCLKVIFTLEKKTNKQKLKFNSSCNVSVNLAFYVLDKIHLQPLFKDILLKTSCSYLYIIKEINQNYCKLVKINCCGLNSCEFKI